MELAELAVLSFWRTERAKVFIPDLLAKKNDSNKMTPPLCIYFRKQNIV